MWDLLFVKRRLSCVRPALRQRFPLRVAIKSVQTDRKPQSVQNLVFDSRKQNFHFLSLGADAIGTQVGVSCDGSTSRHQTVVPVVMASVLTCPELTLAGSGRRKQRLTTYYNVLSASRTRKIQNRNAEFLCQLLSLSLYRSLALLHCTSYTRPNVPQVRPPPHTSSSPCKCRCSGSGNSSRTLECRCIFWENHCQKLSRFAIVAKGDTINAISKYEYSHRVY